MGYALVNHTYTGRVVTVRGRRCSEFRKEVTGDKSVSNIYLDFERDFLLVRHVEAAANGTVTLTYDVDYQPDATAGWVPSRWDYHSKTATGKTLSRVECTLTGVDFNLDIPDADFDAAIPPRAMVIDSTSGQKQAYVMLPDGRRSKPVVGDKYITYEALVAEGPEPRYPRWAVLTAAGVIATLSVGALWWRRRRNRLGKQSAAS